MRGNTTGNLMNGGLIVQIGGNYYYTDFSKGEYLCVTDAEWEKKQVLHNSASRNFNVYGHTIIFCDLGDGQKLKEYDLDTGKVSTLVSDNVFLVNVIDDYIFYRNNSDGQKLYRYSLSKKENIPISNCRSWYITPVKDRVYFRNYDTLVLASVLKNGADYHIISKDTPVDMITDETDLFYGNWTKGKILAKRTIGNADAMEETILCRDEVFSINEYGNYLYYSNWSDNKTMYRVSKNGEGRIKMVDKPVWCINICDGHIYYRVHGEDTTLYRVRLDGSQNKRIV